jgi:protein-S-isoprenylcysteine O-methyltransferase Ste14
MTRAGTNVNPYKPTITIVDSGPFGFSRNPLYVAMTIMLVGLTLAANTWWGIFLLPPLLLLMHFGVIRREERYLEGKFGEPYLAYRRRVRRYL